jgi:F-type H+-transporting ATPase subunit b
MMRFDWWTLALQAINFAILVWLLQRFLYKPVLRLLDARREEVAKQYRDAHDAQAKAQTLQARAESEHAAIAAERATLLKATQAEAEEAVKTRRARAEQEARELLDGTRKVLAKEREQALAEAQHAALDLGAQIARRLIDELPMKFRAESWLERLEQHLAAVPKEELEALRQQGAGRGTVTVVTASPLPADTTALWQTRLHARLGNGIAIAFETDPNLIAGVELHLPTVILRLSWQNVLASIQSEMASHADAR